MDLSLESVRSWRRAANVWKEKVPMKILSILLASVAVLVGTVEAFAIDCPVAANPVGNLLTNPGIEFCGIDGAGDDAIPAGWEMDESILQSSQNGFETLAEGAYYGHRKYTGDGGNDIGRFWNMWFKPYVGTFTVLEGIKQEDNYAHLFQTVAGSPGMQYTMTGFAAAEDHFAGGVTNLNWQTGDPGMPDPNPLNFEDGRLSPTDVFFALEFLDSMDNVLDSEEVELKAGGLVNSTVGFWTNAVWRQYTLVGIAPAGTTQVRVRASMIDGVLNPGADPQSFFVDAFSLTAVEAPSTSGDFDNDGDVDGRDFLAWQQGNSPNGTPGGPVSAVDLAEWQGAYNGGALGALSSVPEPTSMACLALCLCCAGMRRNGRSIRK